MKFSKHTIYISLFAILYLIVAFSSFWHACAFFGLANNTWMSIILAGAFEVGQAAVLFALLTSKKDRGRIMPWVLMSMFTLVQVVGNVFSSYKYIITNSVENLRFFKEPIFIWTTLPDDQATVIVTYVVGAILPIAALLLTSMITNYLSDREESKNDSGISKETQDKLKEMLDNALDNTSKKEWNEFLDEKEQDKDDKKTEGTDPDGGVVGEQGDDGSKFIPTPATNEEIEKLKQELEKLKHPKIPQIPAYEIVHNQPIEESEGLKQFKKETNEEEIHRSNGGSENKELQKVETDEQSASEKSKDDKQNVDEFEQIDTDATEDTAEDTTNAKTPETEHINEDPKENNEIGVDYDPDIQERQKIESIVDKETIKEQIKPDVSEDDLKYADMLMGGNILNKQRVQKESHFINNEK